MRLIDADALLEKAWDADTRIGYVQVVDVGDIVDAPTIETEDKCGECDAWNQYKNYPRKFQWIPCNERLPEGEEDFLVTDGESMAVGYYR